VTYADPFDEVYRPLSLSNEFVVTHVPAEGTKLETTTIEFNLMGNEQIFFKAPNGINYSVEEVDLPTDATSPGYYEVSYKANGAAVATNGSKYSDTVSAKDEVEFINTYKLKVSNITLKKLVDGPQSGNSNQRFVFTATVSNITEAASKKVMINGVPWAESEYLIEQEGVVTPPWISNKLTIRVGLRKDEALTFTFPMPSSAKFQVIEEGDYNPKITKSISADEGATYPPGIEYSDNQSHTIKSDEFVLIEYTNTLGGPELPDTGGAGTLSYTIMGSSIMAMAILALVFRKRGRRISLI
jgi:LPXTG-motif cell wall-anchored protein